MKHALLASVALLLASPVLADDKKPRLFTNAETAKAKAALKKRLVATKSCPRPVLRGTAKKGNATTDLLALFEGKDACSARITKLAERSQSIGTSIGKMVTDRDTEVVEYVTACGATLAAAITAAAARESACSPYELGLRSTDDNIARYFGVAALLGQHARTLEPIAGLQLTLDGIRVFTDLTRGHTNAVVHVLALTAYGALVQTAHDILEAPIAEPTKLIPISAELDALIASAPTPNKVLAGEGDALAVWTTATRPGHSPADAPDYVDPADEQALMLYVGTELALLIATTCPPDASYATCKKAIDAAAGPRTAATTAVQTLMAELARSKGSEEARKRTQAAIVAILRDLALSNLTSIPAGVANSIFKLAALRIHVEAVITKTCPSGKNWETDPWKRLRNPPLLGDNLPMNASSGTATVTAPVWYAKREAYTFKCPASR